MRRWTESSSYLAMACHRFGVTRFLKWMPIYCSMGIEPQINLTWIESGVIKLPHSFEARIQTFMLHTHYSGDPNNRGVIWWRHQMETFSVLLALCVSATGDFPSQRPVTRNLDAFFDMRLKKQLSKQWRRRWFETPSPSLWRHCNEK